MKVLIWVGSLRRDSFSLKLAQAAAELAPDNMSCEFTDCGEVPLYNQDLDGEEKPRAVQTLLDQVNGADALIFVTPEFNYGIPGPLKNAIDWASRPAFRSPLLGKPSLVIAHSISPSGGARVHVQLSSVLNGTSTPLFLSPSITVSAVHKKFDESGALSDDLIKLQFTQNLADFGAWVGSKFS